MVNLTNDNDPMLFSVELPNGERLVLQFMEIFADLQTQMGTAEPTTAQVISTIRRMSRTPDAAASASDAVLMAVWHRVSTAVGQAGNG